MNKRWLAFLLAVLCVLVPAPSLKAASLAEGEHILWIDRLAEESEMPQAVLNLYEWLVAEGAKGADGALADPAKATYFPEQGFYGYELAILKNMEPVRFTPTAGKKNHSQAAWEAIRKYKEESGMQAQIDGIMDYALAVTHAYNRDHPEVFWLSGGFAVMMPVSYTASEDGKVDFIQRIMLCFYKEDEGVDIRQETYRDPEIIREDIKKLNGAAESVLADLPAGSRREQLSYLNRWLSEHNSYRHGEPDASARNPLTALMGSTEENGPVCEGYARALKILCDRASIPCVLVNGDAYHEKDGTPEPHMWNRVQLENGLWYGLDVTWNDPVVRDGDGKRIPGAASGYEDEEYFLAGANTESDGLRFADSHVAVNDVTENGLHFINGPALAAEAYPEYPVRVETAGSTENYASLEKAFEAANGKEARITLLHSVSLSQTVAPDAGTDWILDLNGYAIVGQTDKDRFLFTVGKKAALTVCGLSHTARITTNGKLFAAAGGSVQLQFQK